jgi:hypothetical protein
VPDQPQGTTTVPPVTTPATTAPPSPTTTLPPPDSGVTLEEWCEQIPPQFRPAACA